MRATILPYIGCQWVYYGRSSASGVFLIFTTLLYQFFNVFFCLHYLVTSLKYFFLNTPNQWQYSMLLTSGG